MAAMDGGNGGWAQTHGATQATSTTLFLSVDEDQVLDAERNHSTEQVGYVVFESTFAIGGSPGCGVNADCDDGQFCNGLETCDPGLGCQGGSDPCPGQSCDEPTDTCADCFGDGDCDDGLFCNGAETCAAGVCQAGTRPVLTDGVACTDDTCDEGTDTIVHTANNANCDDALFCNGSETCDPVLDCQAGTDPRGGAACDEGTDTCDAGTVVWMSFRNNTTVPGVGTVSDEDIVAYDVTTGLWSLIFDGSDVGLAGLEISGLAVLSSGDLLMSFTVAGTVGGLSIDDSDVVQFEPTSLGATTAGTFSLYFDGSDVGLAKNSEDIDAVALAADGSLIISTTGGISANGASGNDEDLWMFSATSLGSDTAGSFVQLFDGSDVGLTDASEDLDAATLTSTGNILFSTFGSFNVAGVSGEDEDVVESTPTSGSFAMLLDLSALGIDPAEDIGALHVVD
jgi:hypothetical protein